ncbi:MAG TPA: HPr-rel-A system PqqD family peptide chaperone [Longimicrobiaceae bacterium]|nr:HPr-rel-A system PqqD family peptide chaperone [Longimicrobiaceae bacterium]
MDRYAPGDHVVSVSQGGRTVLLDPREGRYHSLDEVGTRVWELLREHPTLDELTGRLELEYDAPREVLRADVSALLAALAERGLIRSA